MNLKKQITLVGLVLLANILINLSINADLLETEKEYSRISNNLETLKLENEELNKDVAKLTSITRIAQEAEKLDISTNNQDIVYIVGDRFAKR